MPMSEDNGAAELKLREREVIVKEREFALKEHEQKNKWRNPVFIGLLATALSILGNGYSAAYQAGKARELERQKFQDDLVLGALNTSDPKLAATRLGFLRTLGYIDDKNGEISYYIISRTAAVGTLAGRQDWASVNSISKRSERPTIFRKH
jgi:hypothetical protein